MPIETDTDTPNDTSTAEVLTTAQPSESSTELVQSDAEQAAISGGELAQTAALNMATIAGTLAGTIAGALTAPLTASAAVASAHEDPAGPPVEPDEQLAGASDTPPADSLGEDVATPNP